MEGLWWGSQIFISPVVDLPHLPLFTKGPNKASMLSSAESFSEGRAWVTGKEVHARDLRWISCLTC